MDRPGKQVSHRAHWQRPTLPWVVRTHLTAAHIAFGEDEGMLAFIEQECSLGDWAMDSVQGAMEFQFQNEQDAILFKMRFS